MLIYLFGGLNYLFQRYQLLSIHALFIVLNCGMKCQ
jgi:hypothetical protein